jgi:hypothetical protein
VRVLSTGACLLAVSMACSDESREDIQWGTVHFGWTIDDVASGALCEELGATRFQAIVLTRGNIVEMYDVPCQDMELETGLLVPDDEYVVQATLVDDMALPKSDRVVSSVFTIDAWQSRDVRVNFGADNRVQVMPAR